MYAASGQKLDGGEDLGMKLINYRKLPVILKWEKATFDYVQIAYLAHDSSQF